MFIFYNTLCLRTPNVHVALTRFGYGKRLSIRLNDRGSGAGPRMRIHSCRHLRRNTAFMSDETPIETRGYKLI